MSAVTGWRASRGSSFIDAPGLIALGLGALVLLAGLSTPHPQPHDILTVATPIASDLGPIPHWIGGLGMVAVSLLVLGARRRVQALVQ